MKLFLLFFILPVYVVQAGELSSGGGSSGSARGGGSAKSSFKPVDGNCPTILKNWVEDDFTDKSSWGFSFKSEAKTCQSSVRAYQDYMKNKGTGASFKDPAALGQHLQSKFSNDIHSSYQDRYLKDCSALPPEKSSAIQTRFYAASARIADVNSPILDEVAYYDSILPESKGMLSGLECSPMLPANHKKCQDYKQGGLNCNSEKEKKKRFDNLVAKTAKNLQLIEHLEAAHRACIAKAFAGGSSRSYTDAQRAQAKGCDPFLQAIELKKNEVPWVRGDAFNKKALKRKAGRNGPALYDFSGTKIEDAMKDQLNANRVSLASTYKNNLENFRCLSTSVKTASDGSPCDFKKIRTDLGKLPALEDAARFNGRDQRDREAKTYLEAESCLLDRGEDREKTKDIIEDSGKAAVLTVLTAGIGSAATGGIRAINAASKVSRAVALTNTGVNVALTTDDLRTAYNECSKETKLLKNLSTKSEITKDNICSDPQSDLSQAREEENNCLISVLMSAPGVLPYAAVIPGLVRSQKAVNLAKDAAKKVEAVTPPVKPKETTAVVNKPQPTSVAKKETPPVTTKVEVKPEVKAPVAKVEPEKAVVSKVEPVPPKLDTSTPPVHEQTSVKPVVTPEPPPVAAVTNTPSPVTVAPPVASPKPAPVEISTQPIATVQAPKVDLPSSPVVVKPDNSSEIREALNTVADTLTQRTKPALVTAPQSAPARTVVADIPPTPVAVVNAPGKVTITPTPVVQGQQLQATKQTVAATASVRTNVQDKSIVAKVETTAGSKTAMSPSSRGPASSVNNAPIATTTSSNMTAPKFVTAPAKSPVVDSVPVANSSASGTNKGLASYSGGGKFDPEATIPLRVPKEVAKPSASSIAKQAEENLQRDLKKAMSPEELKKSQAAALKKAEAKRDIRYEDGNTHPDLKSAHGVEVDGKIVIDTNLKPTKKFAVTMHEVKHSSRSRLDDAKVSSATGDLKVDGHGSYAEYFYLDEIKAHTVDFAANKQTLVSGMKARDPKLVANTMGDMRTSVTRRQGFISETEAALVSAKSDVKDLNNIKFYKTYKAKGDEPEMGSWSLHLTGTDKKNPIVLTFKTEPGLTPQQAQVKIEGFIKSKQDDLITQRVRLEKDKAYIAAAEKEIGVAPPAPVVVSKPVVTVDPSLKVNSTVDIPRTNGGSTPGQIVRVEGNKAVVTFEEGGKLKDKIVSLTDLKPSFVQPKAQVSFPRSDGSRSIGEVLAVNGQDAVVLFEEGGKQLRKKVSISELKVSAPLKDLPAASHSTVSVHQTVDNKLVPVEDLKPSFIKPDATVSFPRSDGSRSDGKILSISDGKAVVLFEQGGSVARKVVSVGDLKPVASRAPVIKPDFDPDATIALPKPSSKVEAPVPSTASNIVTPSPQKSQGFANGNMALGKNAVLGKKSEVPVAAPKPVAPLEVNPYGVPVSDLKEGRKVTSGVNNKSGEVSSQPFIGNGGNLEVQVKYQVGVETRPGHVNQGKPVYEYENVAVKEIKSSTAPVGPKPASEIVIKSDPVITHEIPTVNKQGFAGKDMVPGKQASIGVNGKEVEISSTPFVGNSGKLEVQITYKGDVITTPGHLKRGQRENIIENVIVDELKPSKLPPKPVAQGPSAAEIMQRPPAEPGLNGYGFKEADAKPGTRVGFGTKDEISGEISRGPFKAENGRMQVEVKYTETETRVGHVNRGKQVERFENVDIADLKPRAQPAALKPTEFIPATPAKPIDSTIRKPAGDQVDASSYSGKLFRQKVDKEAADVLVDNSVHIKPESVIKRIQEENLSDIQILREAKAPPGKGGVWMNSAMDPNSKDFNPKLFYGKAATDYADAKTVYDAFKRQSKSGALLQDDLKYLDSIVGNDWKQVTRDASKVRQVNTEAEEMAFKGRYDGNGNLRGGARERVLSSVQDPVKKAELEKWMDDFDKALARQRQRTLETDAINEFKGMRNRLDEVLKGEAKPLSLAEFEKMSTALSRIDMPPEKRAAAETALRKLKCSRPEWKPKPHTYSGFDLSCGS